MNFESIISCLTHVNFIYIYVAAFLIAYIENIFPPFPSDIIVAFCGYLAGIGRIDLFISILLATAGSTLGFMTMYQVGKIFGVKIVETGRLKFISINGIRKIEAWFKKYGYWVVIGNRFLAGTRAVVSFFTGLSEINFTYTTILSGVSALAWNSILIIGGYFLGRNWRIIGDYLRHYTIFLSVVMALFLLTILIKNLLKKKIKHV
jgi:membrane protein DedA with SNARE-associated domain